MHGCVRELIDDIDLEKSNQTMSTYILVEGGIRTRKLSPMCPEMTGPGKVPSATTVLVPRSESIVVEVTVGERVDSRARETVRRENRVHDVQITRDDRSGRRNAHGEQYERLELKAVAHV